jgi:hypothetical protein
MIAAHPAAFLAFAVAHAAIAMHASHSLFLAFLAIAPILCRRVNFGKILGLGLGFGSGSSAAMMFMSLRKEISG